VEKWITDFIEAMINLILPQGLWKTCGKLVSLWKKKTEKHFFLIFHRLIFGLPVEKWKTLFKILRLDTISKHSKISLVENFHLNLHQIILN
jgi:hypothetical protein